MYAAFAFRGIRCISSNVGNQRLLSASSLTAVLMTVATEYPGEALDCGVAGDHRAALVDRISLPADGHRVGMPCRKAVQVNTGTK
ncbi:hypothetical protein C7T36_21740 [Rhodococcus sp. AD45-ID]|nr:hypothetical protein SZ00_03269 [Rhodococcus sp. AD45]PSR40213.1 hypothetical protein C7T36_21740 [Rhodococcus sp. AD45-ID]